MRVDGRLADQLRPVNIIPQFTAYAEGSISISMGGTRVLCNLTLEDSVPRKQNFHPPRIRANAKSGLSGDRRIAGHPKKDSD
jgi:ribonuclease PH